MHKEIEKVVSDLTNKINELYSWNETAEKAEEILAGLRKEGGIEARISVGIEWGQLRGVLIHLDKITSVKEVAPYLTAFEREGFRFNGQPDDYAEISRRSWKLNKGNIPLVISAFFESDAGKRCRFVEVRKELKPVYELVCDEVE